MRHILATVILLGAIIALAPAGLAQTGTWPFVGPGGIPITPTPSANLIPWAYVAANGGGNIPDMGATPDAYFIQNIDVNQEPTISGIGCGVFAGPANCIPTKYTDQLANHCATVQEVTVLTWAGLPVAKSAVETFLMHNYPGNPTPNPVATPVRLIGSNAAAACVAYYTPPPPEPQTGNALLTNPGDAGFLTELGTLWSQTGSNFYPAPYGVYEDHGGALGEGITGGTASSVYSTEYSCGFNSGKPCPPNIIGNGPFSALTDFDSALGAFVNSACVSGGPPCLSMILNGGASSAVTSSSLSCDIVVSGHCHDSFVTGDIDNNYESAYHNVIVANTDGNLIGFDLEGPFFNHTVSQFCSPVQCDTALNTFANFQLTESGNNVKLFDLEPAWGTDGAGGAGEPTQGIQTRIFALAGEWLIPDPVTGMPDRIIPRRLPVGGTTTEAPSFFELTGIPFAPEHVVVPYVWTGSTVTLGGGCPTGQGDSGGIIGLLVKHGGVPVCAADGGGVYMQQYGGIQFNGVNYGKAAVLINTSAATTFTIASDWFSGSPITSYSYQLSLSGGEATCLPYNGVNAGDGGTHCATNNNILIKTCTNTKYCTGSQTVVGNTSAFNGTGTIAPHSGLILMQNN